MPSMAGPTLDVDSTYGAILIGVLVAVFLFGIVTLQTHIYFSQFPDDRLVFRALVRILTLCRLDASPSSAHLALT